jgi:hypothetical protein
MPDAGRLKAHLQAQFDANKVDSISDMYDILAVELSCYRSLAWRGNPIGCHTLTTTISRFFG